MVKPPPRDVSLSWARCASCEDRHRPDAPCPRVRVWLVHSMCLACHRAGPGRYCRSHDTLWAFKGRHVS